MSGKFASLRHSRLLLLVAGMALAGAALWSQSGGLDVKIVGSVNGVSCMECHGSTPKYPILGARLGYDESGHKNNGNSRYANGGGCQQCHTNEGFIDFVAKGVADTKGFVAYPSQPSCATCHTSHETGTLSLRTVAPVTLANGKKTDLGNSNLCANCHIARRAAATEVPNATKTPANKISASWGPHHGPQADILLGTNAYEFAGKAYSTSMHAMAVQDACIACHMSQPEARYGFSPDVGGHSFNIVGEVHEAELFNLSGCVACHKDAKALIAPAGSSRDAFGDKDVFAKARLIVDIPAKDDYDLDKVKEPVQLEVLGLLAKFVNKDGTGLLQKLPVPFYDKAGAWLPAKAEATRPLAEVAALYNYKMFLEDRSLGVHNATYTIQILYDTIQALDPKFDVSKRPK